MNTVLLRRVAAAPGRRQIAAVAPENSELDAAILGIGLFRTALVEWAIFAIAHRAEPFRVDAFGHERVDDGFRALIGELHVRLRVALLVGVARDLDELDVGRVHDRLRDGRDQGLRGIEDLRGVGREVDLLRDLDVVGLHDDAREVRPVRAPLRVIGVDRATVERVRLLPVFRARRAEVVLVVDAVAVVVVRGERVFVGDGSRRKRRRRLRRVDGVKASVGGVLLRDRLRVDALVLPVGSGSLVGSVTAAFGGGPASFPAQATPSPTNMTAKIRARTEAPSVPNLPRNPPKTRRSASGKPPLRPAS